MDKSEDIYYERIHCIAVCQPYLLIFGIALRCASDRRILTEGEVNTHADVATLALQVAGTQDGGSAPSKLLGQV